MKPLAEQRSCKDSLLVWEDGGTSPFRGHANRLLALAKSTKPPKMRAGRRLR